MTEHHDYWSPGGQIYFTGGLSYGVNSKCQTFIMGDEKNIQEAIQTGKSFKNPLLDNIMITDVNNRGRTTQETITRRIRMSKRGK